MADAPPRRPRGRPTLKAGEPSVQANLRLPVSDYAKACELAERYRVTVPDVLRAAFKVALKQQRRLDQP